MAGKFNHPALLCGNINIKNIIGVAEEIENTVLITSTSSVKRYNVNDRKQINSWNTKSWEPFTCPAVYSSSKKEIIATVNDSTLWKLSLEEKNVNDVKKIKLKSKIHALLRDDLKIYLLYKFGYIHSLEDALSSSKSVQPHVIGKNENILEAKIVKNQAVILTQKEVSHYKIYRLNLAANDDYYSISLKTDDVKLLGSCILSNGKFITMSSDGNVRSLDAFSDADCNLGNIQGQIKWLNPSAKVKIVEVSLALISIQGLSANNEGGLAVLWDTKFGICIDKKPFKMYVDPPLGWYITGGVVVADVGSLAYVPISITSPTLASLFGSRIEDNFENAKQSTFEEANGKLIPLPGQRADCRKDALLAKFSNSVEIDESLSENLFSHTFICEAIKKRNFSILKECILMLTYIPEESIILLLKFFIDSADVSLSMDQPNGETSASPFSECDSVQINRLLCLPFSKREIVPHISGLGFANSLILIRHLHHLIVSEKAGLVSTCPEAIPSLKKVCVWMSLLLDTNYHQLVMTSEIDVQRNLQSCFEQSSSMLSFLDAWTSIDALVNQIENFRPLPTPKADVPYTIERIVIA